MHVGHRNFAVDRPHEIADRPDDLRDVADGAHVEGYRCDVAVERDVIETVATVVAEFGRLDSCVANAGVSGDARLLDMSLDQWRAVTSVNLDGVFVTLREAARQMVDQGGGGALVAVSSTSSIHGADPAGGPVIVHHRS